MSDVEALLSVDAGKIPPDTVAFFMEDGSRKTGRALAVLALLTAAGAVACWLAGGGLVGATLLLVAAVVIGVLATPTVPEEQNRTIKRRVMVVTPNGIIVRDEQGLHRWSFDDLSDVEAILDSEPHLDIIDRRGVRHSIEYRGYRRGQKFCRSITPRLRGRKALARESRTQTA